MKKIFLITIFLLSCLVGFILYNKFYPKSAHAPTLNSNTQLANPASVNCKKKGGNLVIKTRGDGGQYGLCYFSDNMACEEWALFRDECPVGGVKTTGFDTIQQQYCAWLGGKTFAIKDAECILPDKTVCNTEKLYDGICP